jgi:hypothetical protein
VKGVHRKAYDRKGRERTAAKNAKKNENEPAKGLTDIYLSTAICGILRSSFDSSQGKKNRYGFEVD